MTAKLKLAKLRDLFGLKQFAQINAQLAELVDALVSGISGEIRGGSSPLLGSNYRSRNKKACNLNGYGLFYYLKPRPIGLKDD